MARAPKADKRHADLRPEQMRDALPRLRKRVDELKGIQIGTLTTSDDPVVTGLQQKVISTLSDIYGADTVEFDQFGYVNLFPYGSIWVDDGPSISEIRRTYGDGISKTISSLETIISLFEEKLGTGDPNSAARARRQFVDLDLHPEIARAASSLFQNGHYANAIEDACKALDGLVRMRSARFDLSGTELMQKVFSPNNPILKFNTLNTESDRSEQQGRMFLFSGAMLAVRNPRAHGLIEDSAENALDYIAFLSLLAKMADKADRA